MHVPFEVPDAAAVEYMWMRVDAFDATSVRGVLEDDPKFALALKRGAAVTRPRVEIAAYSLELPDGGRLP